MWVQLNNEIVAEVDAQVSVFDRGFTYGDGIFETLRAYRGACFRLDAHLERMARAAAALRITLPRSARQMTDDVARVLERNGLEDAVVRINVSRGRGGRGPGIQDTHDPTYVVAAWPVAADLDRRRDRGTRLCTVRTRRPHPDTLPAIAKLSSYLNSVLIAVEAAELGCDDGLALTTDGHLAQCSVANIFFERGGVICTPALDLGVMPGVARALVLDLANGAGLDVEESCYEPGVLDAAGEAFVTNSVVGILPVRSIDARSYVVPGPLTVGLIASYRNRVLDETGGLH